MMFRRPSVFALPALFAGLLLAAVAAPPAARAEFFLPFFGNIGEPSRPAEPPRVYRPAVRPEPRPVRPRAAREPARVFAPAPVSTPSAPAAIPEPPVQTQFAVVVLGDTSGELLAQGLKEAFSDRPEIGVIRRGRGSSGLVRDDFYDWPKAAREMAEGGEKIDAAVVMLGSNDRQPLRDAEGGHDPLSERWRALYAQRVDDMIAPFKAKRIPVLWVGLPVVKGERAAADFLALNEIYKERVTRAGMTYIDIWASFLDENDQYSPMGPDIAGQNARLRSGDGVYFTRAGARKLAFFTERDLNRLIEQKQPAAPETASLDPGAPAPRPDTGGKPLDSLGIPPPEVALSPVLSPRPVAGPVLSLTAPPAANGAVLVPARAASEVLDPAGDAAAVLRQGRSTRPKDGRADDFSWR